MMVVNPLVADAMKRAGEEMPADGVLVMSSGNAIACAASPDIKSILMSDIPSTQFHEIKDGYYDASAALRKLAGALTGVRGLESELAIAKAAMAQMNKSKLGQFV